MLFGLFYGIWRFHNEVIYRDTLLVTISWTLFNTTVIFWALGALYERKQLRKFHRAKAWGKTPEETRNNEDERKARWGTPDKTPGPNAELKLQAPQRGSASLSVLSFQRRRHRLPLPHFPIFLTIEEEG